MNYFSKETCTFLKMPLFTRAGFNCYNKVILDIEHKQVSIMFFNIRDSQIPLIPPLAKGGKGGFD